MTQKHPTSLLMINRSPGSSLILVFFLVVLGAFAGHSVASILYSLNGISVSESISIELPSKHLILMLQGITASSTFIVPPLLYLQFFTQQRLQEFFQWRQSYVVPMLITLGLMLAFIVVDTWFIQWNMAIQLPSWLRTFEVWAQEKEAALQKITTLLTSFSSFMELGIGILVIGIIPAIGEELLFRGLVQNICYKLTQNIHLAIGISAFVFSAIHLQFYGFVPRFLLGGLFGYIYWWTEDLLFPMAAHFFNNAFTLLMLFLHQQGMITQDISAVQVPPRPVLIFFAIVALTLARLLRQQGRRVK